MDLSRAYTAFDNEGEGLGLVRITPRTPNIDRLLDADTVLASQFANSTVFLDNIAKINTSLGEGVVNFGIKKGYTMCSTRLDRVSINTMFSYHEVDGVPRLTPTFFPGGRDADGIQRPEATHYNLTWTPPPGMKVYFACRVQWAGGTFIVNTSLFFAKSTSVEQEHQGYWKLPLSNQFNDGRLCLGDEEGRIRGTSIVDAFQKAVAAFERSNWNTHQAPDLLCTKQVFLFDPESLQPIHPEAPNDWIRWSRRVNHPQMGESVP